MKLEAKDLRNLAIFGGLSAIGVLIEACVSKSEHTASQESFVAGLKTRLKNDGLDLKPGTPLTEIRGFIAKKTFEDKSWMANEPTLGTIQTPARGQINIATIGGELAPYRIDKGYFYPTPEEKTAKFTKISLGGEMDVYVYGTPGTQSKSKVPKISRF